ncbi:uracil-DNA glycosylase [Labrys neptuniae]
MSTSLREVMRDVLDGWQADLPPAWRDILGPVELGFADMDAGLTLEPWEPVFPVRKGRLFPGQPKGAHMLRAFDGLDPQQVRCVVLGQDPYPSPDFSTGRAFEAGNVAEWRELEKMFSVSIRTVMQMIVAARTGEASWTGSMADWPRLRSAIEAGAVALEPANAVADRWVASGALLLNASLTLSRFQVSIDPHQSRGHLPLWRPLMLAVLRHLAGSGQKVIFLGFGEAAAQTLRAAGIMEGDDCILREHPARGDAVLGLPNPFILGNERLKALGAAPIDW